MAFSVAAVTASLRRTCAAVCAGVASRDSKTLLVGGLLLGAVLLVVALWWSRTGGKPEGFAAAAPAAPPAADASGGGHAKFVMFYTDSCPHCVAAKPEFAKLGASQSVDGVTVDVQKVDMGSPEGEAAAAALGGPVAGYPTFRLLSPTGAVAGEYTGARTEDAFKAFLASSLSSSAAQ
jgi:thiol-disulfide isomerase/thioredoxin